MITEGLITDLRALPLHERKRHLRRVIPRRATSVLCVSSIRGRGVALYEEVCRRDLEGIVAKRRDSAYDPAHPWIKIRNPSYSQKEGRHELFERKRSR